MTLKDRIRDFIAGMLPVSLFTCKHISVPDYTVDLGTNDAIRLIQLSDLHSNAFGDRQELLIDCIRSARPDLIVMTGDIFDIDMGTEKTFSNVQKLMEGIRELCPIYYVLGNHEFYADEKPFLSAIASYGAKVLNDEAKLITIKGHSLVLAGLRDPLQDLTVTQRKNKDKDDKPAYRLRLAALDDAAEKIARQNTNDGVTCPKILLAHRPEYIEVYAEYGFDLILSGHAHGGQWIIPGKINGIYAVGQGFFPKYAGGFYEINRKNQDGTAGRGNGSPIRFIVSRGLSYQRPAFPRFGNPPELPLIKLKL